MHADLQTTSDCQEPLTCTPIHMASIGDIPALLRRLRSPRRLEQVQAAEALARVLAGNAAALQALVDAGGVAALASMVVSSSSQAVQRAAARALNVAHAAAVQAVDSVALQLLKQAGQELPPVSLPNLLVLLQTSDSDMQEAAAFLVSAVAAAPQLQSSLVDAGGPTALLGCLRQCNSHGSHQQQDACPGHCGMALALLCQVTLDVQQAVAAAGGAAVLVPLLASSHPFTEVATVQALRRLTDGCPEGQQAAAAAGAIPALAQLLADGTDQDTNIAAVNALLSLRQHWSADAQQVAGSIPALVRILQHSPDGSDQKAALSLLFSIYESGGLPELRGMAAAGAAPALQRLLTAHGQDKAAAELVSKASALLDALNRLPKR